MYSKDKDSGADAREASPGSGCAQVTISALHMYGEWKLCLNGEDIGSIEGHGRITADAFSQLKNVLIAEDYNGAFSPPYEFNVERGEHLEVFFDRGRFVSSRRIDNAAQHSPAQGAGQKTLDWLFWVLLAGYCAAVFVLSLNSVLLALALTFIPCLALFGTRFSTHRAMVDYLADNHPDIWGEIAREQYTNRLWGPRDIIFVRDACADPEYLRLRKKHKKVFWTQMLLIFTFIISYFSFVIIATS